MLTTLERALSIVGVGRGELFVWLTLYLCVLQTVLAVAMLRAMIMVGRAALSTHAAAYATCMLAHELRVVDPPKDPS
jgi:hypothetical protein